MGLSCFSRPRTTPADSGEEGVLRTSDCTAGTASNAGLTAQRGSPAADQPSGSRQLSPARSGLSSAAVAASTYMPALDLAAVAAVVSDPVVQLSTRLRSLVTACSSPDDNGGGGGGAALSRAGSVAWSDCPSFLSARSDVLSDAGSWASGTVSCLWSAGICAARQ